MNEDWTDKVVRATRLMTIIELFQEGRLALSAEEEAAYRQELEELAGWVKQRHCELALSAAHRDAQFQAFKQRATTMVAT